MIRPTLPERLRTCTRPAAALITNLLSLNPAARMSAKEALAHPYFATEDPLPYIAPIDLTDRRDAERQRRELEREREKEREKEKEREREKQRETLARRRLEMQAQVRVGPSISRLCAKLHRCETSLTSVR